MQQSLPLKLNAACSGAFQYEVVRSAEWLTNSSGDFGVLRFQVPVERRSIFGFSGGCYEKKVDLAGLPCGGCRIGLPCPVDLIGFGRIHGLI